MLVPNPHPNKGTHPYYFKAFDKQGNRVADDAVDENKLTEYIGKEPAHQLLSSPANPLGERMISGANIVTGGEGMKGFYDKIVPTYLNKLGKPHGTQVQMRAHMVTGDPEDYGQASEDLGLAHIPLQHLTEEQSKAIADKANKHLHYFPIPPQMSASILKEGMPQYMRGGVIHKAEGGKVQPTIAQMRMALQTRPSVDLQSIGVNEAPNMSPKVYMPPEKEESGMPAPGGVATSNGMPIGGIDMSKMQQGQQLMPTPPQAPPQPPQSAQAPQGGQPPQPPQGMPPMGAPQGGSNILQMTPQGQTMAALSGGQKPAGLAKGGKVEVKPTVFDD